MELKYYIHLELDNTKRMIDRVLDSLTQQEMAWRPCSGCNPIGLILYHVARFEDLIIQTRLQDKPSIWESQKWSQKMNLSPEDSGAHYTVDQVNAFPVPLLADLNSYSEAVRACTLEYLDNISPDELNRQVNMRMGPMPISGVLALVIGHTSQHTGEMSYLRGIQRGMDK